MMGKRDQCYWLAEACKVSSSSPSDEPSCKAVTLLALEACYNHSNLLFPA